MNVLIGTLVICVCIIAAQCVWVKEMENKGLWQGDIVLDPDERIHVINGSLSYASIKGGRWPKGKIPYEIQDSIGKEGVDAINDAIKTYHTFTCLRFHKRTNERAYLNFFRGSGCSSPVGYRENRVNYVSLARGCWHTGTIMHEIGHSMGFYHEQSRPDRDTYITVLWKNIQGDMAYNFNKESSKIIDSLGTPYDFSSMMHYGSTAFSIGSGKKTIVTKDPSKQDLIGQRNGFSEIDKCQLGLMYNKICEAQPPAEHSNKQTCIPTGCDDMYWKCEGWAKMGECYNNPGFMKGNCCMACKKFGCPGGCKDKSRNCKNWATKDSCKTPWMACNCCISCKHV